MIFPGQSRSTSQAPNTNITVALRDGHLVFSGQFPGPTQEDGQPTWHSVGGWPGAQEVPLNGKTLELRMEVVSANRNDVFLFLGTGEDDRGGYWVAKDQDEIHLVKFLPRALLFWEEVPIKNENITLVLALTGTGDKGKDEAVEIRVRVLDKDAGGRVLYERLFVDGPGVDAQAPVPPPKGVDWFEPESGRPVTAFTLQPWVGLWRYLRRWNTAACRARPGQPGV
ncbi:MAG: hypothetical protein AB9869_33360 [Verrucomicrobiia bacterium]